jgi:hypothetical protein
MPKKAAVDPVTGMPVSAIGPSQSFMKKIKFPKVESRKISIKLAKPPMLKIGRSN